MTLLNQKCHSVVKHRVVETAAGLWPTVSALALVMGLAAGNVQSQTFLGNLAHSQLTSELPKLKTIYHAAPLRRLGRETALSHEYYHFLNRYVRYVQTDLHDWPMEPGAKFHKRDGSKEHDVRQNASVALALALLSAYGEFDEREAGVSRAQVEADAIALIRYLSVTHDANFIPTGDGNKWGDHWQSAFWTATAGQAAWLIWDKLLDETKAMVARMVVHEADRFNERPPDNGEWADTKAEENAWNSEIIALAACMFPHHPNAGIWRERAIVYMINSFSTQADRTAERIVDGKRVSERVTTTCIHPDFTLENHHRVHPDYLSTFTLNLRNALFYKMAGLKVPDATFHHAMDCFHVLEHLTATNGSLFYVSGQDWWPHRHELPAFTGGLISVLLHNSDAACMERTAIESLKKMHARFNDGRAFDPREYNYPNVEEEIMARYAELYLAHRLFGDDVKPASLKSFQTDQLGTRIFETGGFVTHRTAEKFVSFTWVNGAMGLVYPADDTWFIAPHERGLVGRIVVEGAKDTPPKWEAGKANRLRLSGSGDNNGFAFVGKFSRCQGKIEQNLAMISLPDAPVIYAERLRAREDVNVKEIATGTVAILNEDAAPIAPNERRVWSAAGETTMRGAVMDEPSKLHVWETTWANVNDKLGVAARASARMAYLENHKYERARLQQELAANYLADVGLKKAGEIISDSVIALVPNAEHTQRIDLSVEKFGESGIGISFGRWLIGINFGESPIKAHVFGADVELAPLNASVQATQKVQTIHSQGLSRPEKL